MEAPLNTGGNNASASGLTALQSLKHITCSTPRMLTASEIKLLRQAKLEIAKRVNELLRLQNTSTTTARLR